MTDGLRRGFGSVRVSATTGVTTWKTSIFPDGKTGTYLLPVKKAVRQAASLRVDHGFMVSLKLVDLGD